MYVVAHFGKAAILERAVLMLHEFLKAVLVKLLVFDVVSLVLLWKGPETLFQQMEGNSESKENSETEDIS